MAVSAAAEEEEEEEEEEEAEEEEEEEAAGALDVREGEAETGTAAFDAVDMAALSAR